MRKLVNFTYNLKVNVSIEVDEKAPGDDGAIEVFENTMNKVDVGKLTEFVKISDIHIAEDPCLIEMGLDNADLAFRLDGGVIRELV